MRARRAAALLAASTLVASVGALGSRGDAAPAERPRADSRVLTVGTWHGRRGGFATIQAAVDAARPGDWILVAPGDYHERADHAAAAHAPPTRAWGGITVRTPRIHLRGLDRNRVIVDGTRPGSAPCSSAPAGQDQGPLDADGHPVGRNGIEVFEASGVTVENLTVCNFLRVQDGGNEVWWNGGDGTGTVNLDGLRGAYLSATTTYSDTLGDGEYGIFVSNVRGPGLVAHTYASNMADASYYIGACPDCNTWLVWAHAQNSALGYSGTNSGGHLVVALSEWDHNKTGISTNSQNNDDAPSPQDGACPAGGTRRAGRRSCTFFAFNRIHDNNNPNVPGSGTAELGPVGTGMVLAGGRDDTIIGNRVERNGAWGLLLVPFPDTSNPPPAVATCRGGVANPGGLLGALGVTCFFDDFGNEVTGNFLAGNGFFGNETNGDLAEISGLNDPGNCWHGNVDPRGVTTAPPDLQRTHARCGVPGQGADLTSPLSLQVICDTEAFGPCPPQPGMSYPRRARVQLLALPREPSLPDPCAGVPDNPWCR